MAITTNLISPHTLNNLAALAGQLTKNLGGDRQLQEQNLRQSLTANDLPKALMPLLSQAPLSAKTRDSEGNLHGPFSIGIEMTCEETSGEITEVELKLNFHRPDMADPETFAVLSAGMNYRFVVLLGSALNTVNDTINNLDSEQIPPFLGEIRDMLGDEIAQLLKTVMSGVVNTIPAKDLGPKGRATQEAINLELSRMKAAGDLAFCDEIVARTPQFLTFLARVYSLSGFALIYPFEPIMRAIIIKKEPLTANRLLETVLKHEALSDIDLAVSVDDNDEVNLLEVDIPLRDDDGNKLDTLAIVFTPDNIEVLLSSGNLQMTAKPEEGKPSFSNVEEIGQLLRPSETLSALQAATNKELVENTLLTLILNRDGFDGF